MTNEEAMLLYKEVRKTVKRYLKRWVTASDSEAFDDVVQCTILFSVRYWDSPKWLDTPLPRKIGIIASRGFLFAMRDKSAPFKYVNTPSNRSRANKVHSGVTRVWGQTNEAAIEALSDTSVIEKLDREYDVKRIFSYKELSDKQRDLARWVLENDPTMLSEYPSKTSNQAVSDLWLRMLRHLEA